MGVQTRQGRKPYRLSRRVLLGGAAVGGTGILLAACGAVAATPAGETAPAEKDGEL